MHDTTLELKDNVSAFVRREMVVADVLEYVTIQRHSLPSQIEEIPLQTKFKTHRCTPGGDSNI